MTKSDTSMKYLFVSYAHADGFGNCMIKNTKKIKSIEDTKNWHLI